MSQLGFGMGFENVQKVLAQMIALKQQQEQDAIEQQRFDTQMGENRRQFDVNTERQGSQFNRTMDMQAAHHRTQNNQWGVEQMGRDQQMAARQALASNPDWAPYAPLINAGMAPQLTPAQQRTNQQTDETLDHTRALERIDRQGAIQRQIANIQKAATTQNSPAAKFISTGLPSFNIAALTELGEDEQDTAIELYNRVLQDKYRQAKTMYPSDPLWTAQGAPAPGQGGSLADRIRAAMTPGANGPR
jgi:hypothetical protein